MFSYISQKNSKSDVDERGHRLRFFSTALNFFSYRNVESSEAGLFAECAHLECCKEVRLLLFVLFARGQQIRHFCLFV